MYTDSHMVVFGAYALFVLLAIGVVLVLWIFMPFSVFGLKGQIRRIAEEQRRTNELLETLVRNSGAEPRAPSAYTPPPPPPAESSLPFIEPLDPVDPLDSVDSKDPKGVKAEGNSADEYGMTPGPEKG